MDNEKKLKTMLVDMMKWFHEFCIRNNLRYYVLGGTMLGAVRHEGFIPWDDDIDVGMPRNDYEILIELMKEETKSRYVLETPDTEEKDFYYPFSKLYDTKTTLVENTKYQIKRGIYLDIFPLDGVGNSFEESKKFAESVYKYDNLLMLKIAGFRKGRSLCKNTAVFLFRFLPINPKKILKKLTDKCKEKNYNECTWIGNLLGAWRLREVMPKEYLGSPTLYRFENIEVFGVEHANEYLTSLYGDWKKLPSIDKRVTHHDYIMCDLTKSYLEN